MKIKIIIIGMCAGLFSSCLNNDFMERSPLDKQTASTVFTNNENFKTYMWQFYVNRSFMAYDYSNYKDEWCDVFSDNTSSQLSLNNTNKYAWDKVVVPTSGGGWDFSTIRGLNLMLDHIDSSQLTEEQKEHWRSVGYFFKALDYFWLMDRFGDVPYLEHYITDGDKDELYKEATPRLELAAKILELLEYARDHIGTQDDGVNTINEDCINALISRFGLFEGTWQKYHGLSSEAEYSKYLNASFNASSLLMERYPQLMSSYDAVFNSKSLSGQPGIILYKEYLNTSGYGHVYLRYTRALKLPCHPMADLVKSYLCTDGRPVYTSNVYEGNKATGDDIMNVEFRNRDRRLYYTVCPPYQVYNSKGEPATGAVWYPDFTRTERPEDSFFIDLMNQICQEDGSEKQLPILQWAGKVIGEMPHLADNRYNLGQVYVNSLGGYYLWKYYNTSTDINGGQGDTDAPIFRMGEILVNHAEAAFELGCFDQTVADATINKLRKRAHIADMKVSEITADFDPTRDSDVDPVLWEIRRERRVELMAEGFRFRDIRRWKKGEYLNKVPKGVYLSSKSDVENAYHQKNPDISKFPLALDKGESGRIIIYGTATNPQMGIPDPGWLDKYYLYPLPIEDLVLNDKLKQNPGYPETN